MHIPFSGIAGLMTSTMLLVAFSGVLFWAVARSAVVLVVFAWDDTQIWLVPLVAGFCVCFDVATVVFELYSCGLVNLVQPFAALIRLSKFKDRASELYRPHSEFKKTIWLALAGKLVQGMLLRCTTCIRSWMEQD